MAKRRVLSLRFDDYALPASTGTREASDERAQKYKYIWYDLRGYSALRQPCSSWKAGSWSPGTASDRTNAILRLSNFLH